MFVIASVVFLVLMAHSDRYGFHRDELYTLGAGRHLKGDYIDFPVRTPLPGRLSLTLFGVSLPGLRLVAGAGRGRHGGCLRPTRPATGYRGLPVYARHPVLRVDGDGLGRGAL